jgi:hypothetical protein
LGRVFIKVPEETPPKKRSFPFPGAAPPVVPLTYFKTRRIRIDQPERKVKPRPPNVDFLYGGAPPVVVPLTYFQRKSAFTYKPYKFKNLAKHWRWSPLFGLPPQLIIMGDGPGGGQLGIPTLIGGVQGVQIFIAGSQVPTPNALNVGLGAALGAQPLRIYSQTIGRGTATFDLLDNSFPSISIELGQTVLIQENGLRLFAGCISILAPEIMEGFDNAVIYHVTAVDKSGIFDHRVVLAPFFLAGMDAADVIRSLFNDPSSCNPPLSQEGITLNNLPASLGALSTDLVINKNTVTQVINSIMTDVGGIWWIDTTSDLHALLLGDLGPAPFNVTDSSHNFRKAACVVSLLDYRNKQYAVSDRAVTPGPSTGTTPIAGTQTTETWMLPQQLANDLGYLPLSVVTNFPMLQVVKLTVNGVTQPVYSGTAFPFINLRHVWWFFPQTNNLIPPNAQNQNPFPNPAVTSPDPSPGDVIVITYLAPQQNSQVIVSDPLAPTFGTCGSGVYEAVQQVKGIVYQSDLNAIAQAILTRSSAIPKQLQYETDYPGLFVGMKQTANITRLDLNSETVTITSIDMAIQEGELGHGTRFRTQVVATNTQDLGNWINWYERFVARTENAIPVPRYNFLEFILGPGGSLAGGVVSSNPQIVKNTGQVILAAAAANVGPTDQTLTLDVVSAQFGSLLSSGPTPLVIPAGSTSLVKITQFLNDPAPLYLYQNDTLTCTATYAPTGPNPQNAGQITLYLQVSY